MDDLVIANNRISQLTQRIETLEELLRTARTHALDQQVAIDIHSQKLDLCERCEERITERLCVACYTELFIPPEDSEDETSSLDEEERANSPYSHIIQA
jgi:uncharacterized metal-binding protein YceD (DUF177 family)